MSKNSAPAASRLYWRGSLSASVAATGSPMFSPAAVFSATPRVAAAPSSKTGGALGARVTVTV